MRCVKYTLFITNLLFAILGLAIVRLGVWGLTISQNVSWFTIVFGTEVFFISFFGCWAAIQEIPWWIITYQVFIVLLIIGGAVTAVPLYMYSARITGTVLGYVHKEFDISKSYIQGSEFFSSMEKQLECCGFHGISDYEGLHIPPSCCSKVTICTSAEANKVGCLRRTYENLQMFFKIAAGTFAAYFGILVTVFIFAMLLHQAILENWNNPQHFQAHTYY